MALLNKCQIRIIEMFTQMKLYKYNSFPEPQTQIMLAPDFTVHRPRVILDSKDGIQVVNLHSKKVSKIKQKGIISKIIGQIDLPDSNPEEQYYFGLTYSTGQLVIQSVSNVQVKVEIEDTTMQI